MTEKYKICLAKVSSERAQRIPKLADYSRFIFIDIYKVPFRNFTKILKLHVNENQKKCPWWKYALSQNISNTSFSNIYFGKKILVECSIQEKGISKNSNVFLLLSLNRPNLHSKFHYYLFITFYM